MDTNTTHPMGLGDPATGQEVGMNQVGEQLEHLASEVTRFVVDEARRNPYRTVLAAAGVGYVLGGGLPRWAMRVGLNAAVRMAVAAAAAKVAVD